MSLKFNNILFNTIAEANTFVEQINICKGFPTEDRQTITWQDYPLEICRFDDEGSSLFLGYGIIVHEEILGCMTPEQITEILTPENNVNLCSWVPPIISGSTENYFTQFFSGNTNY
jgi:hypothetical protein